MTPRTLAALALLTTTPALAVTPQSWVHTTEAEFATGQTDKTVVTNLGDVKLASSTETIAEAPEGVTVFNDIVSLDGVLYIAAGPEGRLLRKRGDAIEEIVKLENEQVFALAEVGGSLVAAISAQDRTRLAVLRDGELADIVTVPDVRYIWDVLTVGGDAFIATGSDGQVFRVSGLADAVARVAGGTDGEPPVAEPVLDANQANVLCLAADGQGRVYAGTDTDGLIYRLTPAEDGTYTAFVIYDAAEPEIGALHVLEDGTVYAGTADAEQAKPGRLAEAATEQAGRPEVSGAGDTEPSPGQGDEGEGSEGGDVAEPGDLPQVPPKAPPIGEPDGGDGTPGDPGDQPPPPPPSDPVPAPRDEAEEPAAPGGEMATLRGERPASMQSETPAGNGAGPAEADAGAKPPTPTPAQYDRLREVIRSRLEAARKTGELQVGGRAATARRPTRPTAGASRSRPPQPAQPQQEGNAVYRIDPQGFVSQVFRESVMILRIVEVDGRLLIATGSEGQVFSVDPRAEETTTLVDLEAEQVPALLTGPDGGLILATANPAQLVSLSDAIADEGTFTGPIMDAQQVSLWGNMGIVAQVPEGTRLLVQTRSGNVADAEHAPWSEWTDATILDPKADQGPLTPREVPVQAPPARFLQYRLTLKGGDGRSPVVDRVESNYVTPNLRPTVSTLTAAYPDTPTGQRGQPQPEASTTMNINWEASDPNGDTLLYRVEYQPEGSDAWITLVEDHAETSYEWQTRRVPDGRYLLRVVASDSPSNPSDMALSAVRRSDPVLVDNTPPALTDLETTREGDRVTISGRATDQLSLVASLGYVVDSGEHYETILPRDLIFDSTTERFSVTISDLSPGPHVVTLRVRDRRGNTTHVPVLLQPE